jgi:hypothetical protein
MYMDLGWCRSGGAASLFILCILHVNTSLFLPFSRSIAEYDGDTMSPPKNHFIHISVYFRFRLFCTETDRQSQTCRAGQILQGAVQSCTARHPSVTSVVLWTTVQLCPDCTDWPGFADQCSALHLLQNLHSFTADSLLVT